MTKLLANKKSKFILGIILAVLLVVTMFPVIHAAYGEGDGQQIKDSAVSAVEAGEATDLPEGSSGADGEGAAEDDPLHSPDPASSEDADAITPAEEVTEDELSAQAERAGVVWSGNTATINSGDTVNLTSALTLPNGAGAYTLTVNGTLNGRIEIKANQTLNLKGTGTINGASQKGSVITVKGKKATLILNEDLKGNASAKGLTITGGTGTAVPTNFGGDHNTQLPLNAGDRAGGGIHV